MGTHIMERSLLLCCLVALVVPAHSLKCHTFVGDDNGCSPTEVTCPGDSDKCSTTALYIDSFPCKVQKVFRGCINSTTTSKKISISPNELTTLSLQQEICDSDLCNKQEISDPNKNLNDLYCHSCISPGIGCNSKTMKEMRCMGEQNMCVDMKVVGSFGDIADVNVKGCAHIPSNNQNLAFSSQTSSVSVKCCNENFCNSEIDFVPEDKTPNGIQCYSCNTLDESKCSPEEVVKAQCYGDLTYCLEVAGTHMKDGRLIPTMIKGCATPSMCDSSVLPLLQKLGTATVKCCNGSLCNNQLSERGLEPSGYYPAGNVSPGTGTNTTGSGNNTSAGTTGSSSFGGYTNMPGGNGSSTTHTSSENGTRLTNEWNNSNNSSNQNMAVPLEYANIPGSNHSSPSNSSSGNGTGMTNEWISGNDSIHNMATPVGYHNIPHDNGSSTSYTGNGTGMPNGWSNSTSSNLNMSVPGGYANISGHNISSTSHTSSSNGTSMTNEWSNGNSSNHNMVVTGGYDNMPGSNASSTSNAASSNGTGMINDWSNSNSSYHNMGSPGGHYGSVNSNGSEYFSNSNYSSNSMMPNNGSTYGNDSHFGSSWGSIGSYSNDMSSGPNNNGSHFNSSGPGGSSHSNNTAWIYGSNYDPNRMPNNTHNGSFSDFNIQTFLSMLNSSIYGNDSNGWIQNNSFFSNLMPPGMNHNGSGPSGYNINSIYNRSLSDYFNSLGSSWNKSNIHNITSIFSGGNNGSFNMSNFGSGWGNIMYNPNLMDPHAHHNGSSYSNVQNPSGSPNSNGSTNTDGYFGAEGYDGRPINGNGQNSYQIPPGGDNTDAFSNYGNNMGHENMNSNSYDSNMMIPGVGSGGSSYGGESTDGNSNGYNTNGSNTDGISSNGYNPNVLVPGRSTNDSTSGGADNGSGGGNGTMSNGASSLWTKSGSFFIFSAIALLVLN